MTNSQNLCHQQLGRIRTFCVGIGATVCFDLIDLFTWLREDSPLMQKARAGGQLISKLWSNETGPMVYEPIATTLNLLPIAHPAVFHNVNDAVHLTQIESTIDLATFTNLPFMTYPSSIMDKHHTAYAVANSKLYDRFRLHFNQSKKEDPNSAIFLFFHGTGSDAIANSILLNGFSVAHNKRDAFGVGNYLTTRLTTALDFAKSEAEPQTQTQAHTQAHVLGKTVKTVLVCALIINNYRENIDLDKTVNHHMGHGPTVSPDDTLYRVHETDDLWVLDLGNHAYPFMKLRVFV